MTLLIKNQKRNCIECAHYNKDKYYCQYLKRKLSPQGYCLVDGNMVSFLKHDK